MRKIASLLTMLTLCSALAFAQTRTVSGVVRDDKGEPVPFATVTEAGTRNAVQADANGNFSIKVGDKARLAVSATGFAAQTISVNGTTATVSLSRAEAQMQEVVVTALGVKRRADVLSYATQGIKGDKLTTTRTTDINTALAGKIAGVQVRTQSAAKLGSTSTVRLRGAGSLTDKNPLYVVDGTPIDDPGYVNVDDIDDMQILKGPAATALYGQRADAGAILITTKKGSRRNGIGIEVNSSAIMSTVGTLPKYQNEYSGGTAGVGMQTFKWDASMPAEWKALDGKQYHTYYDDASWGPKMEGQEYIPWYAWIPGSQYSFKTAKLTPQKNNIRDFYDKGMSFINNINFSKSGDGYSTRISFTNQDDKGLIPYSTLKRNSVSTQTSVDLSKNFTVGANVNFISQKVHGEFQDTYGNNSSGSFNQWFHRDLDMNILKELKDLRTPLGAIPSWNLNDFPSVSGDNFYHGTLYWTNPFTYYDLASAENRTERLFGDFNLTYKLNDHFKIAGFARRNQRNTTYESFLPAIFENSTEDMSSPLAINGTGGSRPVTATYRTYLLTNIESNYEFLASFNQKFGDFAVDANAGGNIRENNNRYVDNGTKGGLVVADLFALSNSKVQPFYYDANRSRKNVRSLYGRTSVNWKDVVIIDGSLRNDWSSALPADANSYLYPSVGGSVILSKYVKNVLPFVNFFKVRSSWAQAGSDLDPYQLALSYSPGANQWNGNITMTTPDKLVDPNIKPSLSSSFETGLDFRLFNSRLGFSGTYYKERKKDDIISIPVTGASGFTSKLINAGEITRSGVELTLDGSPINNKNFQWNSTLNYAKNTSKIVELAPGIKTYLAGTSDYSSATGVGYAPALWHVQGEEWGQLRGRGIKKIDGKPVINPATGLYVTEDNVNFGTVLPDFTGGFLNQFNYKGLSLNIAIDFAKGGQYFSLSDHWGGFSGLYDYTAGLNDRGKPVRDDVAAGGGVHVVGVDKDNKPVDMYVDAIDYYQGNGVNKINEMHIFKLDYIKLREVALGYKIPTSILGKASNYIQNIQINAFARNPWLIYADNRNFDPSELVGVYGESGQLPPSRSYGLTLKVGF